MPKVWIEVALNGAWSRRLQPGIPETFDWQVYARIIEGIRAQVDVPVYPSYPAASADESASARFAHIEALAERGLLDFAVIDPGSVNFTVVTTTPGAKP